MTVRRCLGVLLVGAGLVLAGCTSAASVSTSTSTSTASDAVYTPILAEALAGPSVAPSTDGLVHLAYELELTNTLSESVTLDALTVLADGIAVQTLAGDDLAARMTEIGSTDPATVTLTAGRSAIVYLDVTVTSDEVPSTLSHRLDIAPETGHPPVFDTPMSETVATLDVDTEEPVVVGAPLAGDGWFDANSCCDMTAHRLAVNPLNGSYYVPERFAIDFVQLDAEGRVFDGAIDDLSSYAYEGAEVLAVADATVVSVTSDREEQIPGANPAGGLTLDEYGGNYVVLDIGGGNYAFYAHLQPGNPLNLTAGQTVSRGDVIGYLGNSGNSSAPHLHFHIMDSPSPLASNGVPFVFDQFTLAGTVPSSGDDACAIESVACELDTADAGERTKESPLNGDVLDFE